MPERSKKFLQKEDKDPVHIGNLVHWEIKQKLLRKKDIADKLSIAPTTLNQYFKQPSLQTVILWRLSRAINFNFLMYLGQKLDVDYLTEKEQTLQEQLKIKEKEIYTLKTQLEVYKQIHKVNN